MRVVNSINQREEFYSVAEFEVNLVAEALKQGAIADENDRVAYIAGTLNITSQP